MKILITTLLFLRLPNTSDQQPLLDLINTNRAELELELPSICDINTLTDVSNIINKKNLEWNNKEAVCMAVIYQGSMVGMVNLAHLDKLGDSAILEFWIDHKYNGKGIIAQSCSYLIEYAFNQLKLKTVTTYCAEKNIKSRNVLKILDFTCNANNHIRYSPDRSPIPTLCFSLRNIDWARKI